MIEHPCHEHGNGLENAQKPTTTLELFGISYAFATRIAASKDRSKPVEFDGIGLRFSP